MLLAGLVVFGLAGVAGGFVHSPEGLIAARAVMGLGAALTFPSTLSLLTESFVERRGRALAIGLWGATAGVAIALGPIVGGFLLAHFAWSSAFFVFGPVAAVAFALVALAVPARVGTRESVTDVPGLLLSAGFMLLIVWTIIEAPSRGWTAPATLVGFIIGTLLVGGFVWREFRTANPMLDVRIFANRRFSAASGAVTVSFFTLFGFIFLMTQYFQFIREYSALSTGVHLLPVAVSVAIGSVLGTRFAVRIGTKAVVTAGLVLMGTFYIWVALKTSVTLSYNVIALQMVVYGVGMGLTSAPATESIMGAVSGRQAGVGSAINDSTRLLGGTLGVAIIGSVYASVYGSRLAAKLPAHLPNAAAATAHQSIGAAIIVSGKAIALGHAGIGAAVRHAASSAFIDGMHVGCGVAAGLALAGALAAALFLPAQPPAAPEIIVGLVDRNDTVVNYAIID